MPCSQNGGEGKAAYIDTGAACARLPATLAGLTADAARFPALAEGSFRPERIKVIGAHAAAPLRAACFGCCICMSYQPRVRC